MEDYSQLMEQLGGLNHQVQEQASNIPIFFCPTRLFQG